MNINAITAKQREEYNKLNNLFKKVMHSYYVDKSGIVIPTKRVIETGLHFSYIHGEIHKTILHLDNADLQGAHVVTDAYFTGQRDHKQKIKGTCIEDNRIAFCNDALNTEPWRHPFAMPVGHGKLPDTVADNMNLAVNFHNRFNESQYGVVIKDELLEQLIDGDVLELKDGPYHAIVTKKLFPQANVKSIVSVRFTDHPDNDDMFHLIINVFKDGGTNTHVYACIRF